MSVTPFPAPSWDKAVLNLRRPPEALAGESHVRNMAFVLGGFDSFSNGRDPDLLTGPQLDKMLASDNVPESTKDSLRKLIPHMSSTRVNSGK